MSQEGKGTTKNLQDFYTYKF